MSPTDSFYRLLYRRFRQRWLRRRQLQCRWLHQLDLHHRHRRHFVSNDQVWCDNSLLEFSKDLPHSLIAPSSVTALLLHQFSFSFRRICRENDQVPWYVEPCAAGITSTYSSGGGGERAIVSISRTLLTCALMHLRKNCHGLLSRLLGPTVL